MSVPTTAGRKRRATWITIIFAVIILLPAGFGFFKKLFELIALVGDPEGAFAVMPVMNYLLASLGFLFLFLWAIWHGMFRDLEGPPRVMLENEAKLDAEAEDERDAWKGW
jgi:nitrogen fixation-related uncharacterized protein